MVHRNLPSLLDDNAFVKARAAINNLDGKTISFDEKGFGWSADLRGKKKCVGRMFSEVLSSSNNSMNISVHMIDLYDSNSRVLGNTVVDRASFTTIVTKETGVVDNRVGRDKKKKNIVATMAMAQKLGIALNMRVLMGAGGKITEVSFQPYLHKFRVLNNK